MFNRKEIQGLKYEICDLERTISDLERENEIKEMTIPNMPEPKYNLGDTVLSYSKKYQQGRIFVICEASFIKSKWRYSGGGVKSDCHGGRYHDINVWESEIIENISMRTPNELSCTKNEYKESTFKYIAVQIANDIQGRKGLGNEWENIDDEKQKEIVEEWSDIIQRILM